MPEGRRQREPIPTLLLVQLPPNQASGPQWPGGEGDQPDPGGGGRCRNFRAFSPGSWHAITLCEASRPEPLLVAQVTPGARVSGRHC